MEDSKSEREKKNVQVKGMPIKTASLQPLCGWAGLALALSTRHHGLLHVAGFLLISLTTLDTSTFSAGVKLLLGPPYTGCSHIQVHSFLASPLLTWPSSCTKIIESSILTSVICFGSYHQKEGWLVALRVSQSYSLPFWSVLMPHVAIILCFISLSVLTHCIKYQAASKT